MCTFFSEVKSDAYTYTDMTFVTGGENVIYIIHFIIYRLDIWSPWNDLLFIH